MEAAKDVVLRYAAFSARDAVHVAAVVRHGVPRIMTFDRGFDAHPDIRRLHPQTVRVGSRAVEP